jgi:hypothetical protein
MPNRSQILALLLLSALPLALAVAGCGADDSAEASISNAKFQKRANLICNNASVEQYGLASRYLEDHPKATEADVVEPAGIPPLEKQLEELQALGLPRGHEEEAEAFFEEFEAGLEELKENPEAALSPDENPFEKANKLAEKYKYGDCSGNP